MTDHIPMARRLRAILDSATDQEWAEGTYWYAVAHSFAAELADRYGVSVECAAGVIAALSPRLSWTMNQRAAETLFASGDAPVLHSNKAKALQILAGQNPLTVLGGAKVRAFYACIVSPVADAVCVDRHAVDAAVGYKGTDKSRKFLDRVGAYESVAAAYRVTADRYGISPAQCQAIVWVVWRGVHGNRRAA